MGRQPRQLSNSGIYHVMVRGINHEHVFETLEDYAYLKNIIQKVKDDLEFSLYAYCFMSNHVHLIIKENESKDIAIIMKKILVRYVMYFNKKYQRSGSLISSRYKSKNVEVDKYLIQLLAYIHRNPIEAGIVAKAEDYPFSSCHDYFYQDSGNLTDVSFILQMFDLDFIKQVHFDNVKDSFEQLPLRKRRETKFKQIISDVLGEAAAFTISGMPKLERNKYIIKLREHGMSIREIERLTGISRGAISNCLGQKRTVPKCPKKSSK